MDLLQLTTVTDAQGYFCLTAGKQGHKWTDEDWGKEGNEQPDGSRAGEEVEVVSLIGLDSNESLARVIRVTGVNWNQRWGDWPVSPDTKSN